LTSGWFPCRRTAMASDSKGSLCKTELLDSKPFLVYQFNARLPAQQPVLSAVNKTVSIDPTTLEAHAAMKGFGRATTTIRRKAVWSGCA